MSGSDVPRNRPARPHPALRNLDVLIGTWHMTGRDFGTGGELTGTLRFEWLEGEFFLVQHAEIDHGGSAVKGIEIIGWDPESETLKSRYFDNSGNAFSYTWEVSDDSLTIWFGAAGSPAGFTGTFDRDRTIISGRWEWPGGGYEATLTRARS